MKALKKLIITLSVAAILQSVFALQAQQLKILSQNIHVQSSFRGLSVINDSVAWVSGNNGWIGRTLDGKNWKFMKIDGYPTLDFRSLYAFDSLTAIVANAGSPAIIFRTENGGKNWKIVYQNHDPKAFFDGIDFWNETEGIIFGDPINHRMLLLRTSNSGKKWTDIPTKNKPILTQGEVAFAASGTSIRCINQRDVIICTGGTVARLWVSTNRGNSWKSFLTPMIQGTTTTGIFSCTFYRGQSGIIVGGDYAVDTLKKNNIFLTHDFGQSWLKPVIPVNGFRSAIEQISEKIIICTGPSGTDVSYDGGETWKIISKEMGFHVIRKARKGNLTILAGKNRIIQVFI